VIAFEHRHVIANPMFLIDGMVAGVWTIKRDRGAARLVVSAFKPLARTARSALESEGARLLAFAAAGASRQDIQFQVAPPRSSWQR